MGIDAISGVNGNMTSAISAIHFGGSQLSEELIKKLKELGIDPTTVKSESEARALIAKAEHNQQTQQAAQPQQTQQPQVASPKVDMRQLNEDIKALGDKLGIDVTTIKDKDEVIDKLDMAVKEYTTAAAAQSNTNATAEIDKTQAQKGVKISTGAEIVDRPENVQAEFKDIKDRVDELKQAKASMFAGQDMLAMMNRMALGI